MKQTFGTARTLASIIEWAGWAIVALAAVGTALALKTPTLSPGTSKYLIWAAGASSIAIGLGLVLAAQLVQAQVATAINTGQLLEHIAKLAPQTATKHNHPQMTAPNPSSLPARQEPYAAKPNAEGRFLRMVKGYELHKYSDGISVNGEGRYATSLEAEKRAAELAANERNN